MEGGLIIPSTSNTAIAKENSEIYCGAYLSQTNGDKQSGVVYGMIFHFNEVM